ncbi:MAG: MerR family transcriptional regulator [Rhodospirillales bacterium]
MATNFQPTPDRRNEKSAQAFRTISEVADELNVPQHVLRFWESKFTQVRPLKRGGGRRYYRPEDVDLLRRIRGLLYDDGYTIKGVQRLLRENRGRLSAGEPPYGEAIRADLNRPEPRTELRGEPRPETRAEAVRETPRSEPSRPQLVRPEPIEPLRIMQPAPATPLDAGRRKELESILTDLQAALTLLRGE